MAPTLRRSFLSGTAALLVLLSPAPLLMASQTAQQMGDKVDGQRLRYLLWVPEADAGKPPDAGWPLLLFLHGSGERGDDLDQVKVHGPPKLVGKGGPADQFVVVSPQCPADSWWKPAPLRALVDEVADAYPIDPDRIYVTGLSMGGYGTWHLLARYPELFAAAAPICGGGDPNRLAMKRDRPLAHKFKIDHLEAVNDLPVWVFHGDADTAVPVAESQLVIDFLKAHGSPVKFTVYPGVGHDSWTQTYDNPELYAWLLQHKREPTSRK